MIEVKEPLKICDLVLIVKSIPAVQAGDHILGQNTYLLLKELVVGLGKGMIKGIIIMYGIS